MGSIERLAEFHAPFCERAEVWFWLSMTERLMAQHAAGSGPAFDMALLEQTPVIGPGYKDPEPTFVFWKKQYERTGLCTTGPLAGHIVEWAPFHSFRDPVAVAGRTLAVDGADFNVEEAQERLTKHAFDPAHAEVLQDILSAQEDGFYPVLIAGTLQLLGFPLDKRQFLGNIRASDLHYKLNG